MGRRWAREGWGGVAECASQISIDINWKWRDWFFFSSPPSLYLAVGVVPCPPPPVTGHLRNSLFSSLGRKIEFSVSFSNLYLHFQKLINKSPPTLKLFSLAAQKKKKRRQKRQKLRSYSLPFNKVILVAKFLTKTNYIILTLEGRIRYTVHFCLYLFYILN